MSRIGTGAREQLVQAMLGAVESVRGNRQARPAQARRADGDQEGRRRFATLREILEAGTDPVAAGERFEFVGGFKRVHEVLDYTAGFFGVEEPLACGLSMLGSRGESNGLSSAWPVAPHSGE